MSTIETGTRFLRRFDDVWMRLKRVGLLKAFCLGGLLAIAGFAIMVVSDYVFELPHLVRVIGFVAILTVSLGVMITRVVSEVRRWNQRHTAATIEKNFPELGQSVRTAIEFGQADESQLKKQGVVPGLVAAMQQQTDRVTLPLDLLGIVKTGGLIAMVGALCFLLGGLISGSALNLEWRTALQRSFLSNTPYTTAASPSGDFTVIEGETATISLEVAGRTDREVTLLTRAADDVDGEWQSRVLTDEDRTASVKHSDSYQLEFPEVEQPFDYRFVAGPASTDFHRVNVKYKLRIEELAVTITPPEYTRLPPVTKKDSSVSAVENSKAVFEVRFDRPPAHASLRLKPMRRASGIEPVELPLAFNGETMSTELDITSDWRFKVHATDEDDVSVESPEYSIRMRRDQAPRIWFEEPTEELEVHTLAEVILRIRVTDDFGLATSGIVFEINNETEHTLVSKDFAALAEALEADAQSDSGQANDESAANKRPMPQTRATLEKLLPLEFFELTQRDSVNYYAYATDNHPTNPRTTATDLRFIDIRPFRRTYAVRDFDDPMNMGGGERVMFLGELIKRERALLNRTRRVATRAEAGSPPDTSTTSSLIEEQQTIADGTLRLVNFLIERDIGGDELLFDAHEVMLTIIDALAASRFSDGVALERDAIKLLVEGRNTLESILRRNPPKARAALRQFSRRESQKLRRPKTDEEEIAELVDRLKQLKREEAQVCAACSAIAAGSGGQNGSDGNSGANGDPTDSEMDSETDEMQDDATQRLNDTEDRQNDIAVEARDIEAKMQDLDLLTDLARERMNDAAALAEKSANDFERKDLKSANESAEDAGKRFGELAKQVDALLKDEIARRIAAARDLANRLAQQQQQMQMALANSQNGKGQSGQKGQNGQNGSSHRTGQSGNSGSMGRNDSQGTDEADGNQDQNDEDDGKTDEGREDGDQPDDSNGSQDGDEERNGGDGETDEGQNGKRPDQEDSESENGTGENGEPQNGQSSDGNSQEENENGEGGLSADANEENGKSGAGGDESSDDENGGGGDAEEENAEREALAAMARQLAEEGRTLEDLLDAIARSDRQEDLEAAGDVSKIMADQRISDTVEQMRNMSDMIMKGELGAAKTNSADIGNRLQLASQDLERLHRRIVSPRIDELMRLERRAVALLAKAKAMESDEDQARWEREARELLDQLNAAQLSGAASKALEDALRTTGAQVANGSTTGGRGAFPYAATTSVVKDLQQRIQELVLGDVIGNSDEAVPPEYERLVERYYQVLSDKRPE